MKTKKKVVVSIIPTGIRCAVGGYIGDATLATNALASVCDYVITNPNAVNAGAFNFKDKNVLYVEGYAIDQLFENRLSLLLPKKNRVGVVLENVPDRITRASALKTIEAFRAVKGVDIAGIEYIPPLKKTITIRHGQFCADIKNIDRLIAAARRLRTKGANAIAIGTHIKVSTPHLRGYQKGLLPNPYGLLEALLSHTIVHFLKIPAAHGPLLTKKEMEFYLFESFASDPRSALENISPAYLGSILTGLDYAPQFKSPGKGDISRKDIAALIAPINCRRSMTVAQALEHNIPVIEVLENKNIFRAIDLPSRSGRIIRLPTYADAVRLISKLKQK